MAIRNAADIDVIKQGLYKTPVKVLTEDVNFRFLQDRLFGLPSQGTEQDFLAMDYKARGVALPTEALKGGDPDRVNYGTGFNEKAIFGLYFNNEDEVATDQADNRIFGEDMANPLTHEERLIALLAEKRDRIIQSHVLGLEKACADAIINGQFTARNGGTQSFPMTASLLSVSGANMSTAPVTTLTAGVKAILKKKGGKVAYLILNPDDAATMIEASAWKTLFDNRRIFNNEIDAKALDGEGVGYIGTINLPGAGSVKILTYCGAYDVSGTWTYLIPSGTAILCPEKIGYKGYCGVYVDNGLYSGKTGVEHGVHVWAKEGALPHTTHVQVQSAPCPMLTAIDGYCVFTSVA